MMQEPLRLDELTIEAGASYGLAIGPAPGVDAEGLLQRADIALHAAKEDPGSVEAWRPALDRASPRRLALVGELRRALEQGDLQMDYQPKVVLSEGEVVGVEALVRWPHPELGMSSADDCVPLAEQTGLMRPLTAVVLRVALAQCRNGWTSTAGWGSPSTCPCGGSWTRSCLRWLQPCSKKPASRLRRSRSRSPRPRS